MLDIVATLKNVHRLLKDGGVLLMNEFINCPVWIQTVFGTLDGWWKFVDGERRTMGPTLSEQVCAKKGRKENGRKEKRKKRQRGKKERDFRFLGYMVRPYLNQYTKLT